MEKKDAIKFASTHSRNPHDWEMIEDMDNRFCFVATNKGVKRRCGLIVTQLAKSQGGVPSILEALKKKNVSYNASDVKHGLKRLVSAGIATNTNGTYNLTGKGRAVWDELSKKFI